MKRQLVIPWWERGGCHSLWVVNGEQVLSMAGWCRWAKDPEAPPLHFLNRRKRSHRRYA